MLKLITVSELPDYTPAEIADRIAAQKGNYLAGLDALGATLAIKEIARQIATRRTSCRKCVYCDGWSDTCWVPYSDGTMETLDIDPCYDGVLRYLMKREDGGDVIAGGNQPKKRSPVHQGFQADGEGTGESHRSYAPSGEKGAGRAQARQTIG